MKKECIFCGEPPENKNKEHVLPYWLLQLTGDPKRNVPIGYNWNTHKEMIFSFNSLTFPACENCNNYYSDFENDVKKIIVRLFEDQDLNWVDSIHLLDWFDKVRIGLWLGLRYLSKNSFDVDPKFHINQRIRTKDRVLIIHKLPLRNVGLTIIGANTPLFNLLPSCFSLLINNLLFTNISYEFVISQRLGFPFPIKGLHDPQTRKVQYLIQKGNDTIKIPIIKKSIITNHFLLAQPLFSAGLMANPEVYNSSYVNANSYDFDKGLGKIFIGDNFYVEPFEKDEIISIKSLENTLYFKNQNDFITQALELQNFIASCNRIYYGSQQDKEIKQFIKNLVQFNVEQIKNLKE